MPGKPARQQGLFDDGSLIGFLQSTLEAMEAAAGGQLGEERAKLQELQLALGGLGIVPSKPADTDELIIASQLDKLEEQLQAVEKQIAGADDDTKQLLTSSTAVWAGGKTVAGDSSSTTQPLQATSGEDAGSSGPSSSEGPSTSSSTGSGGGPTVHNTSAAALGPVAEGEDGDG